MQYTHAVKLVYTQECMNVNCEAWYVLFPRSVHRKIFVSCIHCNNINVKQKKWEPSKPMCTESNVRTLQHHIHKMTMGNFLFSLVFFSSHSLLLVKIESSLEKLTWHFIRWICNVYRKTIRKASGIMLQLKESRSYFMCF